MHLLVSIMQTPEGPCPLPPSPSNLVSLLFRFVREQRGAEGHSQQSLMRQPHSRKVTRQGKRGGEGGGGPVGVKKPIRGCRQRGDRRLVRTGADETMTQSEQKKSYLLLYGLQLRCPPCWRPVCPPGCPEAKGDEGRATMEQGGQQITKALQWT